MVIGDYIIGHIDFPQTIIIFSLFAPNGELTRLKKEHSHLKSDINVIREAIADLKEEAIAAAESNLENER